MDQSPIVKRIEEICREFDSRVSTVGLSFSRLELAKRLSETECAAEERGVAALQPTNSSSPKLPCPHLDNVGGCIKTVGHKKCTCGYVNRQLRAS